MIRRFDIFIVFIFSIASQKATATLADLVDINRDLIANYNFSEGPEDIKGNVSNTIVGGQMTIGVHGYGWEFNSKDQSIIGMSTNLAIGNSARTLSAWIKFESTNNGLNPIMLDNVYANLLSFIGCEKISATNYLFESGSPFQVDSNWHHYILSYDPGNISIGISGEAYLYLDAAINGSGSCNSIISHQTLSFGKLFGDSGINSFTGAIDEVRLYSRSITSQDEINALYSVPEPSTYALFGIGAIGMLMVLRRKKTA